MKKTSKFVLFVALITMILSMGGCSPNYSSKTSENGKIEVTLYTSEDNSETYSIEYDTKVCDMNASGFIYYAYYYEEEPVAMYSFDGNTIWIDEDMDGYETIFNGKFIIKETNN